MSVYRKAFKQENRPKLNAQLAKLQKLEAKHIQQLDIFIETSEQQSASKEKRYQEESQAIRSRLKSIGNGYKKP